MPWHLHSDVTFRTPLHQGAGGVRLLNSQVSSIDVSFMSHSYSFHFSQAFPKYEEHISKLGDAVAPLLDATPVDIQTLTDGTFRNKLKAIPALKTLAQAG